MTKMKRVGADSDMKLFRSLKVKKAQRVQERQRKREREEEAIISTNVKNNRNYSKRFCRIQKSYV